MSKHLKERVKYYVLNNTQTAMNDETHLKSIKSEDATNSTSIDEPQNYYVIKNLNDIKVEGDSTQEQMEVYNASDVNQMDTNMSDLSDFLVLNNTNRSENVQTTNTESPNMVKFNALDSQQQAEIANLLAASDFRNNKVSVIDSPLANKNISMISDGSLSKLISSIESAQSTEVTNVYLIDGSGNRIQIDPQSLHGKNFSMLCDTNLPKLTAIDNSRYTTANIQHQQQQQVPTSSDMPNVYILDSNGTKINIDPQLLQDNKSLVLPKLNALDGQNLHESDIPGVYILDGGGMEKIIGNKNIDAMAMPKLASLSNSQQQHEELPNIYVMDSSGNKILVKNELDAKNLTFVDNGNVNQGYYLLNNIKTENGHENESKIVDQMTIKQNQTQMPPLTHFYVLNEDGSKTEITNPSRQLKEAYSNLAGQSNVVAAQSQQMIDVNQVPVQYILENGVLKMLEQPQHQIANQIQVSNVSEFEGVDVNGMPVTYMLNNGAKLTDDNLRNFLGDIGKFKLQNIKMNDAAQIGAIDANQMLNIGNVPLTYQLIDKSNVQAMPIMNKDLANIMPDGQQAVPELNWITDPNQSSTTTTPATATTQNIGGQKYYVLKITDPNQIKDGVITANINGQNIQIVNNQQQLIDGHGASVQIVESAGGGVSFQKTQPSITQSAASSPKPKRPAAKRSRQNASAQTHDEQQQSVVVVTAAASNVATDAAAGSIGEPKKKRVCSRTLSIEDKPYVCPQCNKHFKRQPDLKDHERTHSGQVSPYRCEPCNKGFVHRRSLTRHMQTHSGERPFSCTKCQKQFAERTSLNRHILTHFGARPHTCSLCQKQFAHARSLKKHMEKHTDANAQQSVHSTQPDEMDGDEEDDDEDDDDEEEMDDSSTSSQSMQQMMANAPHASGFKIETVESLSGGTRGAADVHSTQSDDVDDVKNARVIFNVASSSSSNGSNQSNNVTFSSPNNDTNTRYITSNVQTSATSKVSSRRSDYQVHSTQPDSSDDSSSRAVTNTWTKTSTTNAASSKLTTHQTLKAVNYVGNVTDNDDDILGDIEDSLSAHIIQSDHYVHSTQPDTAASAAHAVTTVIKVEKGVGMDDVR